MTLSYGKNACAYVAATALTANTSAACATALTSLAPIGSITGDLTSDLSNNTSVLNTRASAQSGYEANVFGLKKGTTKFKMVWDTSDPTFGIFFDAWNEQTEVFFAALDAAKTADGAQGPAGNWLVSDFQKTEPVDGVQMVDVTLVPSTQMLYYIRGGS
ncbi:MAG TPA: hypothetical protein VF595_01125 [Tepidisphaeraceae bacterium]|jgi:hypothetical protein